MSSCFWQRYSNKYKLQWNDGPPHALSLVLGQKNSEKLPFWWPFNVVRFRHILKEYRFNWQKIWLALLVKTHKAVGVVKSTDASLRFRPGSYTTSEKTVFSVNSSRNWKIVTPRNVTASNIGPKRCPTSRSTTSIPLVAERVRYETLSVL